MKEERSLKYTDLDITDESLDELATEIVTVATNSRNCKTLSCINPHAFVTAQNDPIFTQSLQQSFWLIPDGIGIVIASRFFRNRLKERVTGPDIFDAIMCKANEKSGSMVFFGSSKSNLAAIESMVNRKYPSVRILASISPPFVDELNDQQNETALTQINSLSPDILWVGMTAPKQEKWTLRNQSRLSVGVAANVGAVFDFASGNIPRAPIKFRRAGLEWAYRLMKDPIRLAPRTLKSAPIFVLLIIFERLGIYRMATRYKVKK